MLSGRTQPDAKPFEVGQPSSSSPRFRTLRTVHERYATALATALSAFLRADFQARLQDLSVQTRGGFQAALPSPTCLMVFKLHPRNERMYLHMNCETVFGLMELLLGGKSGPEPVNPRNLTEIEWSLLEEIVRVMVRPLGEVWKLFATIEFEVESLVSEPSIVEQSDPDQPATQPMIRLAFSLEHGEQQGVLELAVPQSLFDATGEAEQKSHQEAADPEARQKGIRHKMALVEEASVSLEVRLEGPLLPVADLMNLKPGQVIILDYPLDQPLHGVVNGAVSLGGSVVSSGGKRAFHVSALP